MGRVSQKRFNELTENTIRLVLVDPKPCPKLNNCFVPARVITVAWALAALIPQDKDPDVPDEQEGQFVLVVYVIKSAPTSARRHPIPW